MFVFPEIDTSFWEVKDREWVAKRKTQWEVIEPMLVGPKSGKGKAAIKQYFLKGKMPDWDKFREWNNDERHVDLFMFIWLHPSWDEAVLTPLRDAYINSNQIVLDDIKQGIATFLGWSIQRACQDYSGIGEEEMKNGLHTDGHNEILFKILMGDLNKTRYELEYLDDCLEPVRAIYDLPQSSLFALHTMGRWLCIDTLFPINSDMLFQFDQPLEWWYQSCEKDEDYFGKRKHRGRTALIEKALWRIHNFNTEKEGETCRTRFVQKVRKMLDEREFIVEIKNMWDKVKAGEVSPEDPWVR